MSDNDLLKAERKYAHDDNIYSYRALQVQRCRHGKCCAHAADKEAILYEVLEHCIKDAERYSNGHLHVVFSGSEWQSQSETIVRLDDCHVIQLHLPNGKQAIVIWRDSFLL